MAPGLVFGGVAMALGVVLWAWPWLRTGFERGHDFKDGFGAGP